MDTNRSLTRSGGQGTIEYVGLVLAVGVLMAAAMLAVHHVRPPNHLPQSVRAPERVPLVALLGRRPPPPPGRFAAFARRTRRAATLVVRGEQAFIAGFGRAAITDFRALVHDPMGTLLGRPGDGIGLITAVLHPVATGRAQVASLRRYVRELKAMDGDEAWVRLMGDLGAVGEDVAISHGRRTVLKRAVRAGRQMRRHDPEIAPPPAHN
jgi:hypothetical protein